jgi:hypothetical protein
MPDIIDQSEDVKRLTTSLAASRTEWKEARDQLKIANARISSMELVGPNPSGAAVADAIDQAVSARVAAHGISQAKTIADLESKLTAATATNADINSKLMSRTIETQLREAAIEAHVKKEAIPDVLTMGSLALHVDASGAVVTADGGDLASWVDHLKSKSPYYWPNAQGAGGKGSDYGAHVEGGPNPWAKESFSLTAQGNVFRQNPKKAQLLMAQANAMGGQ